MAKNNEARFTADIQDFESKMTRMTNDMTKFAKGGTTSLSGLTGAVGKLAGAFGLAASAVQLVKSNIDTAMNFEKSLSSLQSLTGAGPQAMETFKQAAIDMGASTTQTATQVAEAMSLIGSSMPSLLSNAQALTEVTRMTITLAEAASIDVPEAAKALTNSLNQMGAGADEAGRYINVLAAGSRNGAGNIQYLSDAIVKSGAMARIAGVSYEELVAMIESVAKSGVDASTAGTELRNIMLKLESQNDQNLKPSVVGLTTALKNLADQEMDSAEMKNFFGKRTLTVAANLLKEAENMDDLIGKITDTDTAYEQAATNTDNFAGSIDKLKSAWEGLGLAINDSNGKLRSFVDGMTNFLSKVGDVINGDQLGTSIARSYLPSQKGRIEVELKQYAEQLRREGKLEAEIIPLLQDYARRKSLTSAGTYSSNAKTAGMFQSVATQNLLGEQAASAATWAQIAAQPLNSFTKYVKDETKKGGAEAGKEMAEALAQSFDESNATKQQIRDYISLLKKQAKALDPGSEQNAIYQTIERLQNKLNSGGKPKVEKEVFEEGTIGYYKQLLSDVNKEIIRASTDEARAAAQNTARIIQNEIDKLTNGFTSQFDLTGGARSATTGSDLLAGAAGNIDLTNVNRDLDDYNKKMAQAKAQNDAMKAATSSLSNAVSSLGGVMGGTAGEFVAAMAQMFQSIVAMIPALEAMSIAEGTENATRSSNNWVETIAAILAVSATVISTFAAMPKFAHGGIATQPTYGLFGENGPEAIIPLDRLGQMLGNGDSMGGNKGNVNFMIKNQELVGTLSNASQLVSARR